MYAVIASSPLATGPEAEENQILIQTMTHIMYDEQHFGQKDYKFKCDDLVTEREEPSLENEAWKDLQTNRILMQLVYYLVVSI